VKKRGLKKNSRVVFKRKGLTHRWERLAQEMEEGHKREKKDSGTQEKVRAERGRVGRRG